MACVYCMLYQSERYIHRFRYIDLDIDVTFFIPSFINECLGCYHVMTTVNKATANMAYRYNFISFRHIHGNEIVGEHGSSVLFFLRTSVMFSIVAAPI